MLKKAYPVCRTKLSALATALADAKESKTEHGAGEEQRQVEKPWSCVSSRLPTQVDTSPLVGIDADEVMHQESSDWKR